MPQLFSNSQLADITGNENAHWVFATLSRDETQRNNKALFSYIDSIVRTNINEDAIISGRFKGLFYKPAESIPGISTHFIEKQTFEWLHKFYR